MWKYFVFVIISIAVIGFCKNDKELLPKEILKCIEDAKIISPRMMEYYNKCVDAFGYDMEDSKTRDKLFKVESCFDEAKAQDKEGTAIVDKCSAAVETLSDSQKAIVSQIMWELQTSTI